LASLFTFWFSRWSAEADRKREIKDRRESFQKIIPNYIKRIKEMIETLNSERIRLSGENAEGPNTGSLASGKLLEGVGVQLKRINNLPFTGFFSYPEVVEAYTDKSHKSKLKHVRKVELIHKIFGSFENLYTTQLDFINLYNDSQKERVKRMESRNLCFEEVWKNLNILGNVSDSLQEPVKSLEIELNSEFKKTPRDYRTINDILAKFRENKLLNQLQNPYRSDIEYYGNDQAQLHYLECFKVGFSLSDAIIGHDRVFRSVIAIEGQILANFGNTHDSLKRHLEKLELYFKELKGELNGDN